MNIFEQRLNDFCQSFEESLEEHNDLTLDEFIRYELISSWETRIREDF